MLTKTIKTLTIAAILAGSSFTGVVADTFKIRATANSNENDEDYDGLVVFKNYVEAASNGAIEVELFIGTQLCSNGAECLQGVADGSIDVYISTSGGDAVSTAARLESACKSYGVVLIVGPSTYQATKNDFFYLKLDDLAVKGKNVGLDIYTALDLSGADKAHNSSNQLSHHFMHKCYREQKFGEAITICENLKGCFNGKMDDYYDIWIERCNYMSTQKLPSDWDGIFRATTK